jgi:hypothetical protein
MHPLHCRLGGNKFTQSMRFVPLTQQTQLRGREPPWERIWRRRIRLLVRQVRGGLVGGVERALCQACWEFSLESLVTAPEMTIRLAMQADEDPHLWVPRTPSAQLRRPSGTRG